jgi:hypothetical protein
MSSYSFSLEEDEVLPTDSVSQSSRHPSQSNESITSNYQFTVVNFCKVVINEPECLSAIKPLTTKVVLSLILFNSLWLPKTMK